MIKAYQLTDELKQIKIELEEKVAERTAELEQAKQVAEQQARIDPLTGLYNRRGLDEISQHEITRARRQNIPLSIIVIDIDYFKQINDTYGHSGGDQVLIQLASLMGVGLRKSDFSARLGGEEFAVLLMDTTTESAISVGEKLRHMVANHSFTISDGVVTHCTASFGISSLMAEDQSFDDLLLRADEALYQAKNSGRNRVVLDQLL